MSSFLRDLTRYDFLLHAVLAGLLASVACGVIGSYIVVRRLSYIAGGIAHCVLGGIGAALYLHHVWGMEWLTPFHGALAAAISSALVIGLINIHAGQREDTLISALWASGMAAGLLFLSMTPGYHGDLMNYLFGNILMVSRGDLWRILLLDLLIVGVTAVFYNHFLAVCFDEEFVRLRGLNSTLYYLLLLVMSAVCVVLLVDVVGIILAIALLTLPAATAACFTERLHTMMILAGVLCAFTVTGGIALSYTPDLPSGPMAIMLASLLYVLSLLWSMRRRRGNTTDTTSETEEGDAGRSCDPCRLSP